MFSVLGVGWVKGPSMETGMHEGRTCERFPKVECWLGSWMEGSGAVRDDVRSGDVVEGALMFGCI